MPVCHQWASLTHRARRLEPPSVAMARPLATESEVQSAGNCASVPHGLPDAGAFHAPRYCITARCAGLYLDLDLYFGHVPGLVTRLTLGFVPELGFVL